MTRKIEPEILPPEKDEQKYSSFGAFVSSSEVQDTVALAAELTGKQRKKIKRSVYTICFPAGLVVGLGTQIAFDFARYEICGQAHTPLLVNLAVYNAAYFLAYWVAYRVGPSHEHNKELSDLHPHTVAIKKYFEEAGANIVAHYLFPQPVPMDVRKAFVALQNYNKKFPQSGFGS
jgi:hypothetical protein